MCECVYVCVCVCSMKTVCNVGEVPGGKLVIVCLLQHVYVCVVCCVLSPLQHVCVVCSVYARVCCVRVCICVVLGVHVCL